MLPSSESQAGPTPAQGSSTQAKNKDNVDELTEMLSQLYTAPTSEECDDIARAMAAKLVKDGLIHLKTTNMLSNLETEAKNKKSGLAREGALIGICALADVIGQASEPYLVPMLPTILDLYADKGPVVQDAAARAAEAIIAIMPSQSAPTVLPVLFECIKGPGKKWQAKVGALQLLADLSNASPIQIGVALPEIIPIVKDCLLDTKSEVAEQASKTMLRVCNVGGNPDISRHLKDLCDCMAHPDKVPAVIEKLSATTFVADMHGPALAIMVPLLVRALNERSSTIQRQTTIIVDNLCKLVKDPAEAGQFLPDLLPGLERIIDVAALPEIRALATAAKNTLIRAGGATRIDPYTREGSIVPTESQARTVVNRAVSKFGFFPAFFDVVKQHVAALSIVLIKEENLSPREWNQIVTPYFLAFMPANDAAAVVKTILSHYIDLNHKLNGEAVVEDNEEGEELCNIDFSLAYGGMMLLNHTQLRLHRGHRYGLCGPNGAGKTTLMRAIAQGKVDGFPSSDVLRTVFVEHALQGEQGEMSVEEFVVLGAKITDKSEEEFKKALAVVGFTDEMQKRKVASLSGGWKMKLELARAMLMKADILLLDEPTNHLDVTNIKWLEEYLVGQTNVTSIIVSHDSSFLDNVCTNILHFERKKLKMYKGNLSEFVKLKPEAKSYYTLAATSVKFEFPKPSFLMGVKSNTRSIMKMINCTYTYPGASKPSLHNVSVQLSLSSRVGVVGPNGAGKSTMIKLLTGEISPQEGTAWRHPNLRIGYVAQHAFHHLEQHLEKTPNAYIQWRYQGGADREVLEKPTVAMTPEELKQMDTWVTGKDGSKRQVEQIMGRQKLKKSYQYEIKWKNHVHKFNTWMTRERLLELGFEKLVRQFDDKEASREGLGYRELTPSSIRRHLEDVGLDGDIADHNAISGLSGGQKVKVVIAAAMWNNPHMLVLDEPTNFLDREALGGLAVAIRNWGGAVIMISHSNEFLSALCPETWSMNTGHLTINGKTAVEEGNFEDAEKPIVVVNKKKKKSRNELKAQETRRRLRHLEWLASDKGTPKPVSSKYCYLLFP
ncbi:P-loop containing nucleoside triphosphate hydrolase protein [Lobosporangium transversale]|uniref:p-loop containing nucleoside triphosphate hydrolase protein n=1 Tax=Lobosporangium transversale TaxID=64571 RepID=A0A1Y2GJQ0_9FUNG|nr:P-loop containing nucleoside triphosphate hydrolase protein [Lobosporangium transversale]ORZ12962.1 P-loop containing nucleoside triphosphate hydrolase protein [Lobosporangium transversale]|eukprot:XP_021880311.1 P-loop containing nucleoside triphosphate hydrolase protein [Lobosporangium transversale]